ncbi:MAG: methyltransferase [Bacteroidales bacterium]|nr:methyltransferase [Bacteroidales bacterium]
MGRQYFEFQQFTIRHDHCAMKVNTDGVLLGAWAPLPMQGTALDIGTGSGLVALMAAQRAPKLEITGIDIDADAVSQARENATASPFAERISIDCMSLQQLAQDAASIKPFDAILCNPPFFQEMLLPPDVLRAQARHTTTLPFLTLVACTTQLLAQDGNFSIIIPFSAFDTFLRLCFAEGLVLHGSCVVRTTGHKAPKRILANFVKAANPMACEPPQTETLTLMENGIRSEAYQALTRDFYLW